jgi:hypothetical protein
VAKRKARPSKPQPAPPVDWSDLQDDGLLECLAADWRLVHAHVAADCRYAAHDGGGNRATLDRAAALDLDAFKRVLDWVFVVMACEVKYGPLSEADADVLRSAEYLERALPLIRMRRTEMVAAVAAAA